MELNGLATEDGLALAYHQLSLLYADQGQATRGRADVSAGAARVKG
jgi:hypothetical protein